MSRIERFTIAIAAFLVGFMVAFCLTCAIARADILARYTEDVVIHDRPVRISLLCTTSEDGKDAWTLTITELDYTTPTPTDNPTATPTAKPTSTPTRRPSATLTPGPTMTPGACAYVASVSGTKYHLPSCRYAASILPQNKVCFASRAAAEAAGYDPCSVCMVASTPTSRPTTSVTSTPVQTPPTPVVTGYVASKSGTKFHLPSCRYAASILPANLVEFASREDAIAAGYDPCSVCKP